MTETKGYFGQFGGSFVPEPIQALLDELEATFEKYKDDPEFLNEYRHYLADYSGRETPLYFAESRFQFIQQGLDRLWYKGAAELSKISFSFRHLDCLISLFSSKTKAHTQKNSV